MAIFETFTLLFKADSAQLKKEVDDVKKKSQETADVFQEVEEQTKKTDNEFVNLSKSLAKVAATYFGTAAVIGGFKSSLAQTMSLNQLTKELDIDIETLSQWGNAVKNAGGDANAFFNSVTQLARKFNLTGEQAFDYLPRLADDLARFDSIAGAQKYGQEVLNLDPGTIAFLYSGGAAVSAAIERQRGIGYKSEEDRRAAESFNKAIGELDDAFTKLKDVILVGALPSLEKLTGWLTDIVQLFTLNAENSTGVSSISWAEVFKQLHPSTHEFLRNNSFLFGKYLGNIKPEVEIEEQIEPGFTGKQVPLPPIPGSSHNSAYEQPANYESLPLPTMIPQVSNSQARSLYVGDININGTAKDAQEIGREIVGQIDKKSEFLNQLQQSNSYYDDAVVV